MHVVGGGGLGMCVCACVSMCVCLKYKKKKKKRGYTQLREAGRALSVPVASELAPWGQEEGEVRAATEGRWTLAMDEQRAGCPWAHGAKTHKQKPQKITGSPSWGGGSSLAVEQWRTQLGAGGQWRPPRHRYSGLGLTGQVAGSQRGCG